MHSPIFITGMPRSGVSMFAQAIEKTEEVWIGNVYRPFLSEPGFMENKGVCEHVVKPFLKKHCIREDAFLPGLTKTVLTKEQFLDVLKEQGYQSGKWMYADHRLLSIQQSLSEAFPEAMWLVIQRKEDVILKSCQETAYLARKMTSKVVQHLQADNVGEAWRKWYSLYSASVEALLTSNCNTFLISDEMSLEEVEYVFTQMHIPFSDETKEYLQRVRK